MAQASFEPETSRSRVVRSAATPHWLGQVRQKHPVWGTYPIKKCRNANNVASRQVTRVRSSRRHRTVAKPPATNSNSNRIFLKNLPRLGASANYNLREEGRRRANPELIAFSRTIFLLRCALETFRAVFLHMRCRVLRTPGIASPKTIANVK